MLQKASLRRVGLPDVAGAAGIPRIGERIDRVRAGIGARIVKEREPNVVTQPARDLRFFKAHRITLPPGTASSEHPMSHGLRPTSAVMARILDNAQI